MAPTRSTPPPLPALRQVALLSLGCEEVADTIRWYLESNRRCERFADYQFRIEDPYEGLPVIIELPQLGAAALRDTATVAELRQMADRYAYSL